MNRDAKRWTWRLLGILGVYFMVAVVWREIQRGEDIDWPSPAGVVAAGALIAAGMWLSSVAWLRLLGSDTNRAAHRADFFSAQLGKYLPGGVWQPLGQVGLSSDRGVSKRRSAGAIITHAGTQTAVGLALAFPYAFRSDLAWTWRFAAGVTILAPIASYAVVRFLERSTRFVAVSRPYGSPGRAAVTTLILLVNLLLQGVAFSIMASVPLNRIPTAALAFGVAWALGFLAVPFPAGLGIREAVLLVLLPGQAATIVTASVAARIVTIAVEFALIVVTRLRP